MTYLIPAIVLGATMFTPPSAQPSHRPEVVPLAEILKVPVEHVSWSALPLSDILRWLRSHGQFSIVPVWRTLRDEGITPDTPVTLTLTNTTVGKVLNEVVDQLSEEVRWRGIGQVLHISTRRDFANDLFTRIYNLGDVLHDTPDFLRDICRKHERTFRTPEEQLDRIREHIVETIAPESWIDRGGKGSIEIVPETSALIVRNTPEVHTMIGGSFSLDDAFDGAPITPKQTAEREPRRSRPNR